MKDVTVTINGVKHKVIRVIVMDDFTRDLCQSCSMRDDGCIIFDKCLCELARDKEETSINFIFVEEQ